MLTNARFIIVCFILKLFSFQETSSFRSSRGFAFSPCAQSCRSNRCHQLYLSSPSPPECSEPLDGVYPGSIQQFLRKSERYHLMEQSLELCNLLPSLDQPGNFTIFACPGAERGSPHVFLHHPKLPFAHASLTTDETMSLAFARDLEKIFSGNLVKVNQTLIRLLPEIMSYHIITTSAITLDSLLALSPIQYAPGNPNLPPNT